MDNSTESNRPLFLKLIREEVAEEKKKPVFESYKNVCRIVGSDEIDYLEFEYFYMAFYNNPEFKGTDYDRKMSPSFSELPMEIHSQVLKELNPVHRLIMRKVSKRLRSIIDNDSPQVNSIKLTGKCDGSGLSVYFDDDKTRLDFFPKNDGCQIGFEKRAITVPGVAHHEMALNILRPLFLNPKLKLQNLTMWCDCEVNYLIDSLTEIMKNCTKSPFHVENLAIALRQPMELTSITALFEPGVLKTIDIQGHQEYQPRLMDFLETPHFKQAKTVNTFWCEQLHTAMVERLLHLESFDIEFLYVSIEDLRWLRKIISRTPTLKQCKLHLIFHITFPLIEKAFPAAVLEHRTDASYYRYPIPNSSFFLEFKFNDTMIEVERKIQE